MMRIIIFVALLFTTQAYANPYWNPQRVPKDTQYASSRLPLANVDHLKTVKTSDAIDVLRIQIDWAEDEKYEISKFTLEPSGTPALITRSKQKPSWGSYLGILKNNKTGEQFYDAIGTGKEYRKLARAINLRFPIISNDMTFELFAENPTTGKMEKVLSQIIDTQDIQRAIPADNQVEVKELALASKSPSVRVNIYAEGYLAKDKKTFWEHAVKAVRALQGEKFPGVEYMSFYAVFHPSNKELGEARNLGLPVPEYDSFLGLFFPYWDSFGRWYHVVYPTREDKFRHGLASAPYDYAIVLVNVDDYWGVGNYMSHTAIPAGNSYYFTYLLLHEFGHYFGLNEEYQGGGRTELEFAPQIREPWSQNITFLADPGYDNLKWKSFVDKNTKIPTPDSTWHAKPPVYGAYDGGYADSTSTIGHSHRPGLHCVMESYEHFCDICAHGITQVVNYGRGINNQGV